MSNRPMEAAPRNVRLTDVRLLVDRFDECVAFYSEVMGLDIRLRVPENVYAELDGGGTTLGIYRRELMDGVVGREHQPGAARTDFSALVFRVDDVDAAHTRLRDAGATFVTEPHDQEAWGLRVAHLRDPDGNLIELYHPLEAA